MDGPTTIGTTVETVVERAIFSDPDPRVQRLKALWDTGKRETREALERVCDECYRTRLDYHRICKELQPEVLARADASVLRQLAMEEYDERLATIWADISRRLNAVMEDIREEREEA